MDVRRSPMATGGVVTELFRERLHLGFWFAGLAAIAGGLTRAARRSGGGKAEPVEKPYLPLGDVELVRLPGPSEGQRWRPYSSAPRFRTTWWDRNFLTQSKYSAWSGYAGGPEVLRALLAEWFDYSRYLDIPNLGPYVLHIEFLEVADDLAGYGYGRRGLEHIAERFPGHRLVASAKEAASYWENELRWAPYLSRERHLARWPLFVAPKNWPNV